MQFSVITSTIRESVDTKTIRLLPKKQILISLPEICRLFKLPGLVPGTCTAFHYLWVILNEVYTCVDFIFPCAAWLNVSLSSIRSAWFSGSTSPPKRSYRLSSTTHEEPTYKSLVNNFDLPCFRWFTLCLLFLLRDPWKLNTDPADAWLTRCSIITAV